MKIDPETSWVRGKNIVQIVVVTAFAVLIYARVEQRLTVIESQQLQLTHSIDKLTEQIGRVFVDSVATRQAQQWIENQRIANRDKNPSIIWTDLPR